MTVSQMLLPEFDLEMANTRKILECVPEDKFGWKPHQKSFTLGKLANHLANIPVGAVVIIMGRGRKPSEAGSKAQLLEAFDNHIAAAREALAGASDEDLARTIHVTPTVTKPRLNALRGWVMNHSIHHRGQLSVYLRLLDMAVPGIYGPSADEKVG